VKWQNLVWTARAKGFELQVNSSDDAMKSASRLALLVRENFLTHFIGAYLHGSLTLNAFRAG